MQAHLLHVLLHVHRLSQLVALPAGQGLRADSAAHWPHIRSRLRLHGSPDVSQPDRPSLRPRTAVHCDGAQVQTAHRAGHPSALAFACMPAKEVISRCAATSLLAMVGSARLSAS